MTSNNLKQKIIIADIASLRKDDKGFGHYIHVAEMYQKIFSSDNFYCSGGPIYKNSQTIERLILLPYDTKVLYNKAFFFTIIDKIRAFVNAIVLFKQTSKDDIIIAQPYSFFVWMISIILFGKNRKIYLIEYRKETTNNFRKVVFSMARKRIKGVICPNDTIGKSYELPFISLPDYIYIEDVGSIVNETTKEYDMGVVGIMSDGKDIEDVVCSFNNSKYTVLILGHFPDRKRYERIKSISEKNITVIDKYLSDREYQEVFDKVKYIILPYNEYYETASSGVIYDAIFHRCPVIATNVANFQFIETYKMGMLYSGSLDEVRNQLENCEKYVTYVNNIERYLEHNYELSRNIISFVTDE